MSRELQIGDAAPDFRATAVGGPYGTGREVSLKDFRGKSLILYFYPKDDTPGCTVQACGVRNAWDELKTRTTILGVSPDSIDSHRRFIEKFQLPFSLLSDSARQMAKGYHVWVEKNFMGKKSMGVERSTFVIDDRGRISAIFRKAQAGPTRRSRWQGSGEFGKELDCSLVHEMLGLRADGISQEETQSENLQTQAAKTHEGESAQEALALQGLIRRGLQTAPAVVCEWEAAQLQSRNDTSGELGDAHPGSSPRTFGPLLHHDGIGSPTGHAICERATGLCISPQKKRAPG